MQLDNGVAEQQGNVKVVQTLLDIPRKTAGIGHKLANGVNLCALKCHSARHDKSDIARAENYNLFAGHISLDSYKLLRRSRAVHAGRSAARNVERAF